MRKYTPGKIYTVGRLEKKYQYVFGRQDWLHREIANAQPGEIVDHINGDTLDNRPENLRIVTASFNVLHQKRTKKTGSASGYRNVYLANNGKSRNPWRVILGRKSTGGPVKYLGSFKDAMFAAAFASTYRAVVLGCE